MTSLGRIFVVDDTAAPIEVPSPLRYRASFHWGEMSTGTRTMRHVILVVGFFDASGKQILQLHQELGTIYAPPEGWPQAELQPAPLFYGGGLEKLAEALDRAGAERV